MGCSDENTLVLVDDHDRTLPSLGQTLARLGSYPSTYIATSRWAESVYHLILPPITQNSQTRPCHTTATK
jgi:hypothetical protein